MKKSVILFFAVIACFSNAFAQITLLHTFDGQGWNLSQVSNDGNVYNYVEFSAYPPQTYYHEDLDRDNNTYTVLVYDANFQVQSNLVYNIPIVSGYKPYAVYLSKTIFNDNANDVEMAVDYQIDPVDYYSNQAHKIILYSENGNQIFDFGYSSSSVYVQSFLHYFNNEYRIGIQRTEYDADSRVTTYKYEIYRVPKTNTTGLQQVPAKLLPYPNPTRTSINIPLDNNGGTLNIYDINGRTIQSIPANGENINLNVSGYPSGQYIYEQNGNTNSFIVR